MDISILKDKLEEIADGVFEVKDLVKRKWSNSCLKATGIDVFNHLQIN